MKIALLALLLAISFTGAARQFAVGGTQIEIPTPAGFVRVTPEMTKVNDLVRHFVPATNEQLTLYIAEADAPAALAKDLPSLTRRLHVQLPKKLVGHSLTASQFKQLQQMAKADSEKLHERARDSLDLSAASKVASRLLDASMVIKAGGVVPMPYHEESDRTIASSMLMVNEVGTDSGVAHSEVISATSTYVFVKDKLLFLYVYGSKDDLEWTREKSKEWAAAVVKANAPTVESPNDYRSSAGGSIDWGRVMEKSVSGAFVGLIIALIAWFVGRYKES